MKPPIQLKRILIFIAFTFGIAWKGALIIYRTGGITDTPDFSPGLPLALVVQSTLVMWAPGVANLLTRLITGEGWQDLYLSPHWKKGWPYWIIAWLLPPVLIVLGATAYYLVFPQHYDPTLAPLRTQLGNSGQIGVINLWSLVIVQGIGSLLLAPAVNGLFTLGEEFGWRAYLLPKLLPLGKRRAFWLTGLVWGIWHWPLVAMGFNYGLDYGGWPWLGLLAMTGSCLVIGTVLAWLTLRAGSLWPAVIAHAVTNAIAGITLVCAKGEPHLWLGPLPAGFIALSSWLLVAAGIYIFYPRAKD